MGRLGWRQRWQRGRGSHATKAAVSIRGRGNVDGIAIEKNVEKIGWEIGQERQVGGAGSTELEPIGAEIAQDDDDDDVDDVRESRLWCFSWPMTSEIARNLGQLPLGHRSGVTL